MFFKYFNMEKWISTLYIVHYILESITNLLLQTESFLVHGNSASLAEYNIEAIKVCVCVRVCVRVSVALKRCHDHSNSPPTFYLLVSLLEFILSPKLVLKLFVLSCPL